MRGPMESESESESDGETESTTRDAKSFAAQHAEAPKKPLLFSLFKVGLHFCRQQLVRMMLGASGRIQFMVVFPL